ncbi:MAG: hypothetical protein C0596_10730 [Marinilabiliales bacterium]|nr:MAG: hypothetical protein C0596_10730 [Marinilabiliales bacterium]
MAIKNGFNKRPVVNEYANLLSNCLLKIGFKHAIKREYRVFITHDIDDFARYDKFSKFIKALVGDIVKRHSIRSFFITLSDYFKINLNKQKDVYNTFDFLMNKSDEIGVKSRFYFIPGKIGESDVRFDIDNPKVIKTIKEIEKRGHIVGIHPGFETLGNREQLFSEVNRLRRYVDRLEEGRHHYLRVKLPVTLNDWSDAGLKIDSSLGFYSTIGFRSGICQEYEIFDFIERQKTGLIERPLLVMDTALRSETNTKEEFVEEVCKLNQLVKEFSGDFVLLWHNSNLLRNEWYNWDKVYQEILNKIKL